MPAAVQSAWRQSSSQNIQNSAFAPPAWASAAGQQAMQTGQSLAQMPFGIPPQPIAPLQPQQSEAFQSIENVQGAFTPFLEAGLSQMPRPPWVAARARAVAALMRLPMAAAR